MKQKAAILFTSSTDVVLSITTTQLKLEGPISTVIDLKDKSLGEVYTAMKAVRGLSDEQCLLSVH